MTTYTNPHPEPVLFGFIGGSGVYKLPCMQDARYYEIDTPFGQPSSPICVARVEGAWCAFLARHGPHHTLTPTEVNYRANVCAMKILGVRFLLAINAVGSLDAAYRPGDLALVGQLIDRTVGRAASFFDRGIVAHVTFARPTSPALSRVAYDALRQCFADEAVAFVDADDGGASGPGLGPGGEPEPEPGPGPDAVAFRVHAAATLVVIEGPAFSTRAESFAHQRAGGQLIGMTSLPEARLAREAEVAYAVLAMVTDMDAWYDAPHVGVDGIAKVLRGNAAKADRFAAAVVRALRGRLYDDDAHHALETSIVTPAEHVSAEAKKRLAPLLGGKYPQYAP